MSLQFLVSTVVDSAEFGPNPNYLPAQFKDIPYAPFSKNDRLGRVVDWNTEAPVIKINNNPDPRKKYIREVKESFGASEASSFSYFHDQDEGSFSLVDGTKSAAVKRGGTAGRGGAGGLSNLGRAGQFSNRGTRGGSAVGRTNSAVRGGARGAAQPNTRWRDWNKEARTRDASVVIQSDWAVLEEIEFSRLAKLRLEVDTQNAEVISSHGFLYEYDKIYDRVNTKSEKPLQVMERIRYNPTTSEDPVIQQLAAAGKAQIFATDSILSMLMCTTRSVYPWDIVLTREGDKLFMDKREHGPFDFPSVNENAADPPLESTTGTEGLNSPSALSLEATYINQNFAFQVVKESPASKMELENPNPFYSPEETEPLASCAYRYRKFDISTSEDEDIGIVVRTEVDSFIKATGTGNDLEDTLITIKILNEFDSRSQGSGGAPDWRSKLDSQRGAVVATEMKNNSSKLGRWAVQAILAGAEQMKMGYVSRVNSRDSSRHTILATQSFKPRDFAGQMNVNLENGWGIVRTIVDLCLKQGQGKFVLIKDPNKPVIRLYRVPLDAFEEMGEQMEEDGGEIDGSMNGGSDDGM